MLTPASVDAAVNKEITITRLPYGKRDIQKTPHVPAVNCKRLLALKKHRIKEANSTWDTILNVFEVTGCTLNRAMRLDFFAGDF